MVMTDEARTKTARVEEIGLVDALAVVTEVIEAIEAIEADTAATDEVDTAVVTEEVALAAVIEKAVAEEELLAVTGKVVVLDTVVTEKVEAAVSVAEVVASAVTAEAAVVVSDQDNPLLRRIPLHERDRASAVASRHAFFFSLVAL